MSDKKVSMILTPTVVAMAMIRKVVGILILQKKHNALVMWDIFQDVTNGKKLLMFLRMKIK